MPTEIMEPPASVNGDAPVKHVDANQGGTTPEWAECTKSDKNIPKNIPAEPTEAEKAAAEMDRKAKSFDLIAGLNHKVRDAFQRWYGANETAKSLKKRWESMQEELQDLIERHESPPALPLFPVDGDKPATGEVTPVDESWKELQLEEALPELTSTVIEKLHGAQLYTMGDLVNWTAEDGGRRRLVDIAGIGSGNAGKIEEATMAFWGRYKPPANVQPDDKPITTADGRSISVDEMVGEIRDKFASDDDGA